MLQGGSGLFRNLLLYGTPDLQDLQYAKQHLFPAPLGGMERATPPNGWSFVQIPGLCGYFLFSSVRVLTNVLEQCYSFNSLASLCSASNSMAHTLLSVDFFYFSVLFQLFLLYGKSWNTVPRACYIENSCQLANKACRNTFGENTAVFARSNIQSDDIPVNKCILVLFYRP